MEYNMQQLLNLDISDNVFIRSGIDCIDEKSGYEVGEVTFMAGCTGTGKSMLLLNSAIRCCIQQDATVGYYSLENSIVTDKKRAEQIVDREGLSDALRHFYYIQPDEVLTVNDIVKDHERLGFDIIFIDSIDFLELTSVSTGMEMFNNLTQICQRLRKIAQEAQIAVVVNIQLQPEVKKTPIEKVNIFMLSGGKATSYKAACVWAYLKEGDKYYLKCLKDRNGKHLTDTVYEVGQFGLHNILAVYKTTNHN